MKSTLENCVLKKRFSMNDAYNIINKLPKDINNIYIQSKSKFNEKEFKFITQGIIRFSFFIELVKPDISSTKFEIRWSDRLVGDPRFATFEDCLQIFSNLLKDLINLKRDEINLLKKFSYNNVIAYELPIDYILRKPNSGKIHTVKNIKWFFTDDIKNTILLRDILLNNDYNPEYKLFKDILNGKVVVKTYLTDRALTGDHKTNREKRWETHPNSVQFALKRECMNIEKTLLIQSCKFKDVPNDLIETLIDNQIIEHGYKIQTCPVTGEEISFEDFKSSIINKTHGRSNFQVGHLNPLKATNDDPIFGHTAANISWISEDGNRIQGSLSMNEVDNLLKKIAINRGFIK